MVLSSTTFVTACGVQFWPLVAVASQDFSREKALSNRRYPLSWPDGWKRCTNRTRAKFSRAPNSAKYNNEGQKMWQPNSQLSVFDGISRVLSELQRMEISERDCLVSTNVPLRMDGLPRSGEREPIDPGAAVYWQDRKGRKKCMAIDQYTRTADNLAAIAATLDAMRSIERHGGAEILERTFLGFAALPESTDKPWRDVLGFGDSTPSREQVQSRFKELAMSQHPDKAEGSHDGMSQLNGARMAALRELER